MYTKADITTNTKGTSFYKLKLVPNIPLDSSDIYVITTVQDTFTSLANKYYKDVSLWKVIYSANNNVTKGSMFPQPGTQIRIPIKNVSNYL